MTRKKRIVSMALVLLLAVQLLGGFASASYEFPYRGTCSLEWENAHDVTCTVVLTDNGNPFDDFAKYVHDARPSVVVYRADPDEEDSEFFFHSSWSISMYVRDGATEPVSIRLDHDGLYQITISDKFGGMAEFEDVPGYISDSVFLLVGEDSSDPDPDPTPDPTPDPDPGPAPDPVYFSDVHTYDWFYDYVDIAANKLGLVNGKAEGKFCPYDNMTYAEAITLAARIHAYAYEHEATLAALVEGAAASDAWYKPYLDYADAFGISWRYPNYNANATRADYVHIFYTVIAEADRAEFTSYNTVRDGAIPDVPMSHKYAEDIYAFYRAGVLDGADAAYNFKPTTNIRRSEVAAVLCRLFGHDLKSFTLL